MWYGKHRRVDHSDKEDLQFMVRQSCRISPWTWVKLHFCAICDPGYHLPCIGEE